MGQGQANQDISSDFNSDELQHWQDAGATFFLDVEASALESGFPIEVGYAALHPNGTIYARGYLIHHAPWLDEADRWNPKAEAVHGISPEHLAAEGLPPKRVCALLLNDLPEGVTLYSDYPEYDREWLQQLFDTAGLAPMPKVASVADLFEGPDIDERRYDAIMLGRDTSVPPLRHRAADDAARWAWIYGQCKRQAIEATSAQP